MGRLRHRSTKNSRPERDRELVESYRAANVWCEGFPMMCQRGRHDGEHIHHIAHDTGRRWDRVGNIIHLCDEAHRFCHEHSIDGKILCLYAKLRKDELTETDFNVGSVKRLPGWLSSHPPTMPEVEPLWRELMDRFVDEGE